MVLAWLRCLDVHQSAIDCLTHPRLGRGDTPNRGERPGPQWHCVWQRSGTVLELSRAWERHGVRLHAAVCEAAFVLLTRTRTRALRVATDLVKMDQLIYNSEHKRTLSS